MSSYQSYYPTPCPASSKANPVVLAASASSSSLSLSHRSRLAHVTQPRNREAGVDLAAVDEMPPLELDAITVHGDGDSVVCGDAFFVDDPDKEEEHEDPYAPATSLRLRIGEDIDWCDVGGGAMVAVLRRDDSIKGAGANPKSAARKSVQAQAAAPRSSMSSYAAAQRKVVPVVIGGLPSPAAAGKVRCSPCRLGGRARVLAAGEQQQGVVGRHHHLEEPGSPKVSCLGAVRPEQRAAGRGTSRREWWRSWFAAPVTCCFSSHQSARRASRGSEADE